MKKGVYVFTLVLLVLSISLISAGLSDIWNKITGNVPSQPQNVSVGVVGASPVTISVPVITASPTENNFTNVSFTVNVTDTDGVNDINDSSVSPTIINGPTTRNGNCSWIADRNSTTANYSCSVVMWYFDTEGSGWTTRVQAKDIGNQTLMNGTATLTYNQLKAMVISPTQISWPSVIPGTTNKNASDDPTVINNTGNYNGAVLVTGYNLIGQTNPVEMIPASGFRVSASSGTECSGTPLVNATDASITGSNSNPGNLSAGGGQSSLYYCIPLVPSVSSQFYSTTGGNNWIVKY
jgi:hypothetical protein